MQVVTGAMGALIPKLFQLLNEEYKLQKGVKQDVEFLTKELPSMHEALRRVADVPRDKLDKQVKIWADEVRELSYVMEDVVDSFLASAEGSEPATNSHKLKELLNKMGNLLPKGKVRHKTAKKIQGIKILVKEVADRRDRYRVNDAVVNLAATTRVDPRLLALFKEQKELVGIDVARDEIMKKLTDGDANEPKSQLKILSIFGFGGLGKTTLAKAMHDKLRENFVYGAFISVGQKPDLKKVLRDIIIELESEWYRKSNALVMDEKQLIQNLQELLENKRYFIIIDDIWDVEDWEIIRCAFKDSNCRSRIITTTRIFKVAEESDEVYQLKPLSHDNSEKLFYARLYGGKSESPFAIPTNTSERILQKCGGVPLAVLTIASLLEGKPREDWSKVYDSIGFGEGENHTVDNTRKILLFSYHDLPYYLRACLLHISIYQEDYIILKSSLIWKWVAEGFIKEEPGISQFELGERYFNELVNRSMIQPIESKDLGLVVGCRVHDLVLDMICLLSKEQNFVTVVDTDDETASSQSTMARRLAVQKRVIEKGDSLDKVCKPQVRSFNATTCDIRVMPSMSSFGALRVLAMEDCTFIEDGNYHLNHLGSLIQLRYLGLRNMPIIELPEEIGNLKFLQTLDLGGTRINCFPQSIGLLRHLKCLNVDFSGRKEELHLLRNLTLLEELTLRYDRGSPEVVVELGKLTELRKLYMAICFMSDFDDDDCMVKALVKSLGKLQKIQVLHLRPELMDISCDEWHGYAPPRSLHELRLRTYSDMLPEWINPSLLPNLTQLSLMVEEVDAQDMEILGSFPELVTLTLESDSDMDSVPDVMGNGKLFPKLKYFSTPALRFLQGAMPSLECLVFDLEHPKLEVFEFGLVNLPSLQRVKCNGGTEEQRHALKVGIKAHPNCPTLEFEYYFKPRGWFYY